MISSHWAGQKKLWDTGQHNWANSLNDNDDNDENDDNDNNDYADNNDNDVAEWWWQRWFLSTEPVKQLWDTGQHNWASSLNDEKDDNKKKDYDDNDEAE